MASSGSRRRSSATASSKSGHFSRSTRNDASIERPVATTCGVKVTQATALRFRKRNESNTVEPSHGAILHKSQCVDECAVVQLHPMKERVARAEDCAERRGDDRVFAKRFFDDRAIRLDGVRRRFDSFVRCRTSDSGQIAQRYDVGARNSYRDSGIVRNEGKKLQRFAADCLIPLTSGSRHSSPRVPGAMRQAVRDACDARPVGSPPSRFAPMISVSNEGTVALARLSIGRSRALMHPFVLGLACAFLMLPTAVEVVI